MTNIDQESNTKEQLSALAAAGTISDPNKAVVPHFELPDYLKNPKPEDTIFSEIDQPGLVRPEDMIAQMGFTSEAEPESPVPSENLVLMSPKRPDETRSIEEIIGEIRKEKNLTEEPKARGHWFLPRRQQI